MKTPLELQSQLGGPRDILAAALDLAIAAWLRDLQVAQATGLHGVAAALAQRITDAQTARDALSD